MQFSTEKIQHIKPTTEFNKTFLISISHKWLKWRYSFLRKSVEQDQIRDKIIFLVAEFTYKNQGEQNLAVAVTILEYTERVVLDEKIYSRQQVVQVGTRFYGIKEQEETLKKRRI